MGVRPCLSLIRRASSIARGVRPLLQSSAATRRNRRCHSNLSTGPGWEQPSEKPQLAASRPMPNEGGAGSHTLFRVVLGTPGTPMLVSALHASPHHPGPQNPLPRPFRLATYQTYLEELSAHKLQGRHELAMWHHASPPVTTPRPLLPIVVVHFLIDPLADFPHESLTLGHEPPLHHLR